MNFLRTVSTRRLLATLTAMLVAIAAGTAIAVAATSGGPVPKREPLAVAVRQALTAKAPTGVTARISFTNNLISSTDVGEVSDPLLTGAADGRVWITADRARLELQSASGDVEAIADRSGFWIYDAASNTVYRGSWPKARTHSARDRSADRAPTLARIRAALARVGAHLGISAATPTDVAGQAAYRVSISPKARGGLLGDLQLAWDAAHGIPLDVAVYARGNTTPVLELKATDISFGPVDAGAFQVAPPSGAKVVTVSTAARAARHARAARVAGVSRHLSFRLDAKPVLAGRARRTARVLDWGGTPAALLLYGTGLNTVAVVERPASRRAPAARSQGGDRGVQLPTISIGGTPAQVLATELGTVVTFTRGGIEYIVLGSVPQATAEAVARGL
jgi:outer membrane lipoprotein-sorting protein